MHEVKYASIDSQLGNAPCLCEDTEEMFWLRESDDYESQIKLGNLLSGQYRFREAVDAYHADETLRQAEQDKNDLNAVVTMYGITVYLEYCEKKEEARKVKESLLRRKSVWPCISYLAAWNDMKKN